MTAYELEVLTTLQSLQIPSHMRGFHQIQTAMTLVNSNPQYIHKMLKLYTKVGELHHASPRCIEGNIRNALQSAKTDFHVQKEVLGTNRELGVPEFLATLHRAVVIRVADKEVRNCFRMSIKP